MLDKKIVVALFSHKKKNLSFDFNHIQSILIKPVGDAIGDACAHSAYAAQIKKTYPNCKVGIFATKRNKAIYELSPFIDEILEDNLFACLKNRKKWQVFLDCYETFTSQGIIGSALLAPKINIIYKKHDKKYYTIQNIQNYDYITELPENCHMLDRLQHSKLSEIKPLPAAYFDLSMPKQQIEQAARFWQKDKIRILLAPQGSYEKRFIPEAELAQLLNNINQNQVLNCQFVMCHAKNSGPYFDKLKSLCRADIDLLLAPKTSLHDYLALVASADMAICIDSGTVHLACAFRKPLLAFFANLPSNLSVWYPRPNENVPQLTVIADTEITKLTYNFPLDKANIWLDEQIKHTLLKGENHE